MIFHSGNIQLQFYMPPCIEKDSTYSLITENGGQTLSTSLPGSYYLLPYESNYTIKESFSHPVYSYTLVHHSVSLQEFQDPSLYILNPSTKPVQSSNKIAYSSKEDNQMREYVLITEGNPKNLSFWIGFKSKTGSFRSPDSLRAHWKFLDGNHLTRKKEKKVSAFKQLMIDRARNKREVIKICV